MEFFVIFFNGVKPLTIFSRNASLDGWQGSQYTSVVIGEEIKLILPEEF